MNITTPMAGIGLPFVQLSKAASPICVTYVGLSGKNPRYQLGYEPLVPGEGGDT